MITHDREYRAFDFLAAPEGDMIVEGVPVVFNQETLIYKDASGFEYREMIDANAFSGAKMDDVVLVVDHIGKPLAKTKNGTLELELRGDGLYMRAQLNKNSTGREAYEDILNGFYDKMSFSFVVSEEEYRKTDGAITRVITRIKDLYDVSVVTRPAYNQTSVIARSWAEAEAEARQKAAEAEQLRQKLILKTYL